MYFVDVHKPTSLASFLRFIIPCHVYWLFWYGSERCCTYSPYLGTKARGEEQNKGIFPCLWPPKKPCCISALCYPFPDSDPAVSLPTFMSFIHITTATTRKEMWSAVDFEELKLKEEKKGDKKKKGKWSSWAVFNFLPFCISIVNLFFETSTSHICQIWLK